MTDVERDIIAKLEDVSARLARIEALLAPQVPGPWHCGDCGAPVAADAVCPCGSPSWRRWR